MREGGAISSKKISPKQTLLHPARFGSYSHVDFIEFDKTANFVTGQFHSNGKVI